MKAGVDTIRVTFPEGIRIEVGGNGLVAYLYLKGKKGDPHVVMAMSVTVILTQSILPDTGLSINDITFSASGGFVNLRTPRFDLDSVYGRGPRDTYG